MRIGYRDCSAASSLRDLYGLAAVPEMGVGLYRRPRLRPPAPPVADLRVARFWQRVMSCRRVPLHPALLDIAPADRTPR